MPSLCFVHASDEPGLALAVYYITLSLTLWFGVDDRVGGMGAKSQGIRHIYGHELT